MTHHRPRNRMFRQQSKQAPFAVDRRKPALDTLDENALRSMFASSADVVIKSFPAKKVSAFPALLIYSEGMVDPTLMTQYVPPDLEEKLEHFNEWETTGQRIDKSMEWRKLTSMPTL